MQPLGRQYPRAPIPLAYAPMVTVFTMETPMSPSSKGSSSKSFDGGGGLVEVTPDNGSLSKLQGGIVIFSVQGRVKLLSASMKRFTAALHSYLTLCSASPICL